jgi:chemosensory pili system protein ChpA (sensor histidine kinase/response regulator)
MTKPLALIIEDDAKLNQVFTLSIQEFFETESFTDGDSALARLAQATPHIVLVDLNLPGAPGHKIISHIRADERLRGVRILICSADDRQADALRHEVDFILLKPISPIQLRDLAKRLTR